MKHVKVWVYFALSVALFAAATYAALAGSPALAPL